MLVAIGVGFVLVGRLIGDDPQPVAGQGSRGVDQVDARMLALQVDGAPAPMLAVVGVPADDRPFHMPLSSELTVVVPGQGETSAAGVAALPAESMRVGALEHEWRLDRPLRGADAA